MLIRWWYLNLVIINYKVFLNGFVFSEGGVFIIDDNYWILESFV